MATILEQIANIDASIAAKNARIADLQQSAKGWRDSKSQCPGLKSSSKYKSCAQGKEDQAIIRDNEAAAIQQEINQLIATKETLKETQKTENSIGITLANQGISQPAAIIEAEGKAKAALLSSQIKSTAEADAIAKTADSSSTVKTVAIGIVGLIVVVAVVILLKKFTGKKNPKK